MSALLPCPFCGNDGSGPIEDALQIHRNEPDYVHEHRHTWTVQCDKCTATMGYSDSEDEAVEAWNRRAPSPSPAPGVVEALREAKKRFIQIENCIARNLFHQQEKIKDAQSIATDGWSALDAALASLAQPAKGGGGE